MSLGLSTAERAARVRVDLRIGAVVGICAGDRGVLAGAAETLTPERLADLRALTGGAIDLAVTARRAETLKARAYDGDIARLALTEDATAAQVRDIADPSSDLQSPMKGPFQSRRNSPADLHRAAIRLAKQSHLLPAAVVAEVGDRARVEALCEEHGLSSIDADALLEAEIDALEYLPVSRARVPIRAAAATRVHVFRPRDGSEEHYAIECTPLASPAT
jgi:GTP cyclohydrolase II